MRVTVVGLPGAGKSRLANQLSQLLGCAWVDTDEWSGFKFWPQELIEGREWVASGIGSEFYTLVQCADLWVYLDYPWHVCFGRALTRCLSQPLRPWKNATALWELVFHHTLIKANIERYAPGRGLRLTSNAYKYGNDPASVVISYIQQLRLSKAFQACATSQ